MRHLCLVLAFVLATSSSFGADSDRLPADGVFPILAWGGPPQAHTTPERYRELAECGFTYNYSGFSSADEVAKALDIAAAAGVKLIIASPEVQTDPEGTAKRFKNHR